MNKLIEYSLSFCNVSITKDIKICYCKILLDKNLNENYSIELIWDIKFANSDNSNFQIIQTSILELWKNNGIFVEGRKKLARLALGFESYNTDLDRDKYVKYLEIWNNFCALLESCILCSQIAGI